jgi:5-methylcytosine-specific restriction endonuclease McrA
MSAAWDGRRGRSSKWIRRSTRMAIYHRDAFDCVICRRVFPLDPFGRGLTLDHVTPRSQGGSDRPENLITACYSCNSARQDAPYPAPVLRRVRAQTAKPLDRAAGRALAKGVDVNSSAPLFEAAK